jgi:hypothetical protein
MCTLAKQATDTAENAEKEAQRAIRTHRNSTNGNGFGTGVAAGAVFGAAAGSTLGGGEFDSGGGGGFDGGCFNSGGGGGFGGGGVRLLRWRRPLTQSVEQFARTPRRSTRATY